MKRFLSLTALAGALAGCAAPIAPVHIAPDPADPAAPVSATTYVPVTLGINDYRPVEPKSWTDMNDRVAPGAGRKP
jgi:hypothetical protein